MRRIIRFTEFGTVILNDKEIEEKKFWKRLEDNINDDDYGVMYNEKENRFTIFFGNYIYKVELTDKEYQDLKNGVYSPLVKKLMILSNIQMIVDATNGNRALTSLDKDTKEYYLKMLRKDNIFTIGDITKYFKNLWADIEEAWDDAKDFIEKIDTDIIELLMLLGLVISVVLGATIGGIPTEAEKGGIACLDYILLAFGGGTSPFILGYSISFLVYNTMNRLERLKDNIKTKKLNKVKIDSLESIILEEQKKISDQVPLLPSNDKREDFNKLSELIDNLLESLKGVKPEFRGDLTEKVREVITEYKTISDNKKDFEILTLYPNFINELNELEIEINNAKRLSREQNRAKEIVYLKDKLEKIEEENKGYSYKKTLK